ncbi:excinuclease ABC subunit A [Neisseria sp. N95_16]|uniref:Excinuclease ABC subunit A n=1 Tax=Neisseria brasiliensis TaxID=2666100 RepID=A0A5Q3S4M2_9NEIS|nr:MULTISPECIES: type II toxin-antitoxin system RelE/ParE family toxin [Neisseria]MRN38903.1 excinuclease ABC subunit A [Neisseria brasiliensis]PJO10540.1 excinuclease ABC subunit A [Neisseria sp. N95_16]PJO77294.1 excinuclease ABC subunit A [Neisseria sp. N177_16]QGL25784.1 excinuclease ABC subunit A [Neisseria brasiliensis]
MILDFACKETEMLFAGKRVKRFVNIERVAIRKLQQLHAATDLNFLRIPPANHLEALSGDREGQHSIRINAQWRICFVWRNGHVSQVEIVDYH